jgi:addiction module HigA family antidote
LNAIGASTPAPRRPAQPGAAAKRRPALGLPSRRPPLPGEFLATRFLKPLAISQTELALALGVSRRRVNELINGRRVITPDTAIRLALFFGNEAAFWMHLQVAWDMHEALRQMRSPGRKRRA